MKEKLSRLEGANAGSDNWWVGVAEAIDLCQDLCREGDWAFVYEYAKRALSRVSSQSRPLQFFYAAHVVEVLVQVYNYGHGDKREILDHYKRAASLWRPYDFNQWLRNRLVAGVVPQRIRGI